MLDLVNSYPLAAMLFVALIEGLAVWRLFKWAGGE